MIVSETLVTNARNFVKLTGLRYSNSDGTERQGSKGIQTELDAFYFLDIVKIMFSKAGNLVGKSKRNREPYDYVQDIMLDMEELMLESEDSTTKALKRHKNLTLFHMIIYPVVEGLRQFDTYATASENINEYIELCKSVFTTQNWTTSYEDGLIAKTIIAEMIRDREAVKKQSKIEVKRSKRKKKQIEEIEEFEDGDLETELVLD